jgi:hypothetical protein
MRLANSWEHDHLQIKTLKQNYINLRKRRKKEKGKRNYQIPIMSSSQILQTLLALPARSRQAVTTWRNRLSSTGRKKHLRIKLISS